MCHIVDWTTFYREKDDSDPKWSGKVYDFKISRVPAKDWQVIADQAAQHMGVANTQRMLFPCILYGFPH